MVSVFIGMGLRRRNRRLRAELALLRMDSDNEHAARQAAHDELELERKWRRVLFEITDDMVFVYGVTEDGLPSEFIEVNDVFANKLGYSSERLTNMTPLDIEAYQPPTLPVHALLHDTESTIEELQRLEDDRIVKHESTFAARRLMRQILDDRHVVFEKTFVARNGQKTPVQVTAHRLDLPSGPIVICMAHDMTERYAVQQALLDSERRSRDYFTHSPIGVAIYDGSRTLENANSQCLKMFGIPDQREFARFNLFDHPFMPAEAKQRLARGETVRYEARVDFDEARRMGVFVTSRSGYAHIDVLMNNLGFDRDFHSKGYLAQVQDITKRREAEAALGRIEKQLRQAQKMQAIGTLAGGIAHDFNNLLTPILGYAEMALDMCSATDPIHDFLNQVINASLRAKELANQILTFSRQSEPEGRPIHVIPIVKEVLRLQRASLPATIEVKWSTKTQRDVVTADPTQIHQIIMNLCANSAHAMQQDGGILDVSISEFTIESTSVEFPTLEPGRQLRLSVRDTGAGMDAKTADRIFEPFFTTKDRGEGTGMGLAVVHGIVSSLHGTITFETQLGEGTVFHVILPLMDVEEEQRVESTTPIARGSECILFVDDQPEIVAMGAQMLSGLGYRVVPATGGPEALKLFELNPQQFDLIISDQVMPELTGLELAKKAMAMRPEIPVILCTGFSETLSPDKVKVSGVRELLMKPVARRTMAESVRQAIDTVPVAR